MRPWHKLIGQWILFIVLFLLLAMFGLETRDPWSLSSSVWLPSGLVLGFFCISPGRHWPLYGVSAALLHVFVSLHYGRSLDVALTFSAVDLAVLFPLAMMWQSVYRYLPSMPYFTRTLLLLLGVFLGSITGGVVSILVLTLLEYPVVLSHFFTWSLSNATGCLAVAPIFIIRHFFKEEYQRISWGEGGVLVIVVSIFLLPANLIQYDLMGQAMLYLVLGGSLILVIFWPLRMSAVYFFCLTLLVCVATLWGYGPFALDSSHGIQGAQLYLLALISLGLITAAYVKESEDKGDGHRKMLRLLCQMLVKEKPVFFYLTPETGQIQWSGNSSVFGICPQMLSSTLLFQAIIHPKDRHDFTRYLESYRAPEAQPGPCFFRVFLSDHCYHKASCRIMYEHSSSESVGVVMLCH